MGKSRFETRYIAFVDILGFSGIVDRMASDDRLFTTMRDALKVLDDQSREFQRYRRKSREKHTQALKGGKTPLSASSNLQMTAFSDCYVLSEVAPAWHVLAAVQALGSHFLAEGILTRGAVVKAKAYHNRRVLFGPGIVEAYRLESEVAKYPRILVSEAVLEETRGYHEGRWNGQLLKRDVDGCWFVNLLVPSLSSWSALSDSQGQQDTIVHLQQVRRSLKSLWTDANGNPGHMSKVWWLIHRFNQVAKQKGLRPITRG
jgi:hypothetical protein